MSAQSIEQDRSSTISLRVATPFPKVKRPSAFTTRRNDHGNTTHSPKDPDAGDTCRHDTPDGSAASTCPGGELPPRWRRRSGRSPAVRHRWHDRCLCTDRPGGAVPGPAGASRASGSAASRRSPGGTRTVRTTTASSTAGAAASRSSAGTACGSNRPRQRQVEPSSRTCGRACPSSPGANRRS